MQMNITSMAATRHETAVQHNKESANAHEAGDREKAAYHAQVAHGHIAHAKHRPDEASKQHAEDHDMRAKTAA